MLPSLENRCVGAVIHIGPPKTATTSLQDSVIPLLGRPFQIKPLWARAVSRRSQFPAYVDVPSGAIVSDEGLGSFWKFSPTVIADRLSVLFEKSTVIYTRRDPTEMFYSFYRQTLMNNLAIQRVVTATKGKPLQPVSADAFFDYSSTALREFGTGFFAVIDVPAVQTAFERYFKFEIIDFGLLRSAPDAFVESFAVASRSSRARAPIAHVNRTATDIIRPVVERLRGAVPDDILDQYDHDYHHSVLSPKRAAIFLKMTKARDIRAFVNAFRLR